MGKQSNRRSSRQLSKLPKVILTTAFLIGVPVAAPITGLAVTKPTPDAQQQKTNLLAAKAEVAFASARSNSVGERPCSERGARVTAPALQPERGSRTARDAGAIPA